MALTLVTLASGSEANCAVVTNGTSALMIDAGLPITRLKLAFAEAHLKPAAINLIALTHSHGDHAGHAREARLWLSTMKAKGVPLLEPRASGSGNITVGSLRLDWIPTPHTESSRAFIVSCDGLRLGFFHDLGHVTPELQAAADGLDLLAIEANYDEFMLSECSAKPQIVKDRIRGPWGHLSNDDTGRLVRGLVRPPKRVVLLHLSGNCNRPELAVAACKRKGLRVSVAPTGSPGIFRV